LSALPEEHLDNLYCPIVMLSQNFIAHRFDLLGSGWVQVRHGMECKGFEGFRYEMGVPIEPDGESRWLDERINVCNLKESQRIWRLVDEEYTPIDWQLDFKSGYRWAENTWYRDIPYGPKLGADIKVPWELARMQHLLQLSWAYALAKDSRTGLERPEVYAKEFRNQVLDFISTNPPRFGVNWNCTMDVAIRVANWLVAHDLFRAYGACFDKEFRKIFINSIYDHGYHIINNLEWHRELHGNHYLSNIVGLLFVAAYLPCTTETNVWLSFAVQELVNEVEHQFNSDGTNFEASTSYHCLSAELVIYGTALVLGMPTEKQSALMKYDHNLHKTQPKLRPAPLTLYDQPQSERLTPFPPWYVKRLEKMTEFIMHMTKPDGRIPQFGDNDCGRFLKIKPAYLELTVAEAKERNLNLADYSEISDGSEYFFEDCLDRRNLVAAFNGLFGFDDFEDQGRTGSLETHLVHSLAGDFCFPSLRRDEKFHVVSEGHSSIDVECWSYPDFGLYIFRSKSIYLAIRCGSVGQCGIGGHAHNDQLSFELAVGGISFIGDPGTYIYTALPKIRNLFRSTGMHNTLSVDGHEQNSWDEGSTGLFRMDNRTRAKVVQLDADKFVGEHSGFGSIHRRSVEIKGSRIHFTDECRAKEKGSISFHLFPGVRTELKDSSRKIDLYCENKRIRLNAEIGRWRVQESVFSPGYGVIQRSVRLHLYSQSDRIVWELQIIDK
jgi:hypothetical protein